MPERDVSGFGGGRRGHRAMECDVVGDGLRRLLQCLHRRGVALAWGSDPPSFCGRPWEPSRGTRDRAGTRLPGGELGSGLPCRSRPPPLRFLLGPVEECPERAGVGMAVRQVEPFMRISSRPRQRRPPGRRRRPSARYPTGVQISGRSDGRRLRPGTIRACPMVSDCGGLVMGLFQCGGKVRHRRVSILRPFGHRLQADRLERWVQVGPVPATAARAAPWRILPSMDIDRTAEGNAGRQQLVENHPEAVDVAGPADRVGVSLDLLGGHVGRRAQDGPRLVSRCSTGSSSRAMPKSMITGTPSPGDHHVGGLQVPVDHPAGVRLLHRPGQRAHDRRGLILVHRLVALDEFRQRLGLPGTTSSGTGSRRSRRCRGSRRCWDGSGPRPRGPRERTARASANPESPSPRRLPPGRSWGVGPVGPEPFRTRGHSLLELGHLEGHQAVELGVGPAR